MKQIETEDNKKKNFFQVPHKFEELFGKDLSYSEKYFYTILRKLDNRFAKKEGKDEGWFWHVDRKFETSDGRVFGFESFGFSQSSCQRARKKLKSLNLIETKEGKNIGKDKGGTRYKLDDSLLDFDDDED